MNKRNGGTSGFVAICSVLTLLLAVNTFSTDTIAPGIPALRDFFSVDTSQANLAFSVYVFTFGFMQLIYGPISDRFGRRPVLVAGMVLYCLACLFCVFAPTFETLLVGRALQGGAASAAPAVARAVIRDLYGADGSRKVLSYVMSAFGLVAIATPIIGGFLVAWKGWQASFIFCALYALICIILIFSFLKESRPSNAPAKLELRNIFLLYVRLTPNPLFALNCATNLFMYASMFVWLSGSMLVLIDGYAIEPRVAGFLLALGSAGFMVGAWVSGRIGTQYSPNKLILLGSGIAILAALSILLFAFLGVHHGSAVALPAFVWMFGHGLHYPQSMAGAVAPFPENAGAASSLIGFYQTTAAAIMAFIMGLVHDGSAAPFGALMLILSIAALLAYLPFYRRFS